MKILMVCEGINKFSIVAQPWRHVYELAKRMIQHGNKVQILTSRSTDEPSEDKINGIPIIRVKKGKFLFDSEQLLKYLNDEEFDVVNWHGSDIWATIHIWRLRKKLKNNVILTLHSGPLSINDLKNLKFADFFVLYNFWNNVLNAFFPHRITKKCMDIPQIKGVITLSRRLKTYLIKNGIKKEDEIEVIRSGVDVEEFNPLVARRINNNEVKTILYFGELSPFRGVDTLLMAMAEIVKNVPDTKLFLLARDPVNWKKKEGKLEEETKRTRGVVLVKGVLNQYELLSYLNSADVVVLPFRFWPQVECPLTILEAMAMKKPVITTTVGAIPEIVINKKTGILVPPKKYKILAKKVVGLFYDEELANRIGKNARSYVVKFHDWNIIVRETLKTFKELN